MKMKGLGFLIVAVAIMLGSCSQNSIKSAKLKTANDSLSYAFGVVNHTALSSDSISLNPVFVAKAMNDCKDSSALMDDNIARGYIMTFINKREEMKKARIAEQSKAYIQENSAFLAKNKERAGVMVTPSGLQYEVIKMGTGPKPTKDSMVKVHYTGTLIDGTEFDSSVKRNEPAQFPVSGVIPGWTEALQLMPVGSKFKIYLPDSLAYGPEQAGALIKPYSTLIFEVELLEIVK